MIVFVPIWRTFGKINLRERVAVVTVTTMCGGATQTERTLVVVVDVVHRALGDPFLPAVGLFTLVFHAFDASSWHRQPAIEATMSCDMVRKLSAMSVGRPSERSYEPFTGEHLDRLVKIALDDQAAMFARSPNLSVYRDRLLLIALCQGGALHYLDGKNGVKDIDVYSFYARHPAVRMHPFRHTEADFGPSEFGYRPADLEIRGKQFVGRAVDLLVGALPVGPDADPIEAVRDWLEWSKNETPQLLKKKAVVGLYPDRYRAKVVWPSP
ncbi:hypothetical protein [Mycolicibacter terrae]|nr:hypothetical protein [Mycolicibacter terrae]